MKPLYVINDLHLSAVRSSGTTPTTAWQLRQELLQGFEKLLAACDSDVAVNGDFADDYRMIAKDMLESYAIIQRWLVRGHTMYAMPGNHCLSKSSLDLSSFEFLFTLLRDQYPDQVKLLMQPGALRDGVYAIPHVTNSDLLDLELKSVPAGTKNLLVHANYNCPFSVDKDHSLNITEQQAKDLDVDHIIFGHLHQQATALNGKVVIVGNNFPSSVSDCLGNKTKRMLKITDAGMEFIETWRAEDDFLEVDWKSLAGLEETPQRFIRVTGTATAAEADKVVTTLARFRKDAAALVITNAVKIEGVDDSTEMSLSHEEITSFNVMAALLEYLTPEEGSVVTALMAPETQETSS